MSMFKKLKGTFQNAQQDLVDGIKALNPSHSDQGFNLREINLDAGASLLHKFQNNWSLVHSETSGSAQKSEEVAMILAPLINRWNKSVEEVSHLEKEAIAVSTMSATLAQLHALVESLQQDFFKAEADLIVLEDICEELDYKNRCSQMQKQLALYTAKKETEAERLKVDLAHKHARKMAVMEAAKRANLQERAEAFMSAFQDDVNYYQKHGHPSRSPTEYLKPSRLSSVELDCDNLALDSFLGPGRDTDQPGNLELSGEGAYIEDDYITDYSVKQDVDFFEADLYTSDAVISELGLHDDSYLSQESHGDLDDPQNISNPDDQGVRKDNVKTVEGIADNPSDDSQIGNIEEASGENGSQGNYLDTANGSFVSHESTDTTGISIVSHVSTDTADE